MMSLASIQALNDEATKKASKSKKKPYVPFNKEEVEQYGRGKSFPAPMLGDYVAPGWEQVDELFVDKTGWDMSGRALSLPDLKSYIIKHLPESLGYGLGDEGEFQIYVKVFKKKS